ncbi:hypothetical protein LEP1GSC052_0770 [Leptospira kmetyi serovar Malaysia str. Bejo-Iso9]|nr:hypothetical protein LEP1GSC052_0770 [Leptospira kmetyi serovar Malaysia str. Bejo-Iso9]
MFCKGSERISLPILKTVLFKQSGFTIPIATIPSVCLYSLFDD